MFGFRLLAVVLALVCLAGAGVMAFRECPRLVPATEFFVRNFVPDAGVQAFIKSRDPVDVKVKGMIKYTLGFAAICLFGLGLLFLCAAVNPIRMRPFVSVAMICSILGIAAAIWQGTRLGVFKSWWIGDAAGSLLLLILLAALYPRAHKEKSPARAEEESGAVGQ